MTMGAGKRAAFHLGGRPQLFFDRFACRHQLRTRRTADENPFDHSSCRSFARPRFFEVIAHLAETINDARLAGIIRRHLQLYPIANSEANPALPHLARNVREHEMIVRERDTKHRARQDSHDGPFELE